MAYANPFISLILALTMLFSSGAISTGDFSPFAGEMAANGETVSFGMVETTEDTPAAYLSHDGETFYLTGEKSVLVGQSGAAYTPTPELSALLGTAMGLLPQPTEAACSKSPFTNRLLDSAATGNTKPDREHPTVNVSASDHAKICFTCFFIRLSSLRNRHVYSVRIIDGLLHTSNSTILSSL